MEFTKQYPVIRYEDGRETPSMDEVLAECSLNVHINGRFTEVLHCIPEYLEEMLLGRLYTSGVISSQNPGNGPHHGPPPGFTHLS